uniref:Uncharacterized protein n=1 Tax=Biomphalaria glabrata TaxID=6526 RepID=A0A2C9KUQ1_BIOGL
MIKQFSVVLQGKQIHTPALHDYQRVPTRDYISSQDLATPDCIVSSLSLLPMSSSDTATPKNTFFGQTMDQRQTPTVDAFRFAYLQKPLAPSPLVNTPLSGKKLPILIKAKNRNEFDEPTAAESPNENSNVKDSDLVLDPPTSSQTVTNKWNQNEARKVDLRKLEAMNTLKQPRDLPLPLISCLSLPLIKKKDENIVPLTTKLGVGNNSYDYLSEERETKANFSRQSLLENKCLEISQMPINQLNISGAKLRTPVCRRRKFETPKFSRVRYWRGVSSFGAHVTYCSHAPYRARKKGVPPKLTVCKQYVICCDKKLQPNKCPKVDMLFNLAQEETTEEEDNDTRTDLSQGILTSQSTKTPSAIPVTEKELCTPKGNESIESLSSQNCAEKAKLSLQDVQVSPAKSLEMFTSRSRLKNQLSLHDDFPFHCFLLFQFEDRKKAMKRLMRLPQRYQQSLFKIKTKRQGGVSTFKRDKKPKYKPSVEQSHLQKIT